MNMDNKQVNQHRLMAMGQMPDVEGVESPWKCRPDGDQNSAKRALADSQRGMTKRGKDVDHGGY